MIRRVGSITTPLPLESAVLAQLLEALLEGQFAGAGNATTCTPARNKTGTREHF